MRRRPPEAWRHQLRSARLARRLGTRVTCPETSQDESELSFGDPRAWPGSVERFRWLARRWMNRRPLSKST